ncbi:sensor histidine kinase [Pontiella sp.]|uniref:sensor histidine kinase n=1 Tax=Pontiella sp. TaxID=2837462 RepID=UPI00356A27B2
MPGQQPSLTQLEERLSAIDTELDRLARFTLSRGAGSIGWSSKAWNSPEHTEWAEIRLSGTPLIDEIVLVPILWDYADKGPQASSFPEAFQVIAGTPDHPEGEVLARFSPEDGLLPRIAPLVIKIPPTEASWVRVHATQLSTSDIVNRYVFGLSEIMVFSGGRNVAQNQPVRASSMPQSWGGDAISAKALTDGATPFLMNSSRGRKSRTYLARFPPDMPFWLIIDLEEPFPVDEIRFLSASDVRQHIPLPKLVEYGIPRHLVLEGANQADFSDARLLLDHRHSSIYDAGPILESRVPETLCRYIRLSVPDPYQIPGRTDGRCFVNFSELEIISNGRNVAQGKPVLFGQRRGMMHQFRESITDGSNNFGELLPVRDWMEQLARRHDLERERPLLMAELNTRYARQKRNLFIMYWAAGILAAATVLTFLIDRILRMRHVARLKQRFAADLHDELGANLHSIGLISDVAQEAESGEQWKILSRRIRDLTERTGIAVRHCTNLLEADHLYIGLTTDMQRAAERITTNLKHDFVIEGESYLKQLPPRPRIDLFLFYKESLVNICRHSGATRISTRLTGGKKETVLTVSDNGKGLHGQIPASLKRRARLLRARLTVESPESGGTIITLRLRNRPALLRSRPNKDPHEKEN